MKRISINLEFDTNKEAEIVHTALIPEINNKLPKTTVEIYINQNVVNLNIVADDTSTLRAAINSYLRWINTALEVQKKI